MQSPSVKLQPVLSVAREYAARRLTDIQAQLDSILRQEQEVMYRGGQPRRR